MFTTLPGVSLLSGASPATRGSLWPGRTGSGGSKQGSSYTGAQARSHPEQMTTGLSPFLPNFEITEEGTGKAGSNSPGRDGEAWIRVVTGMEKRQLGELSGGGALK